MKPGIDLWLLQSIAVVFALESGAVR